MENGSQPVTRAELKLELSALESRIDDRVLLLEERMMENMRGIETTLLKEFRKWAVPINSRLTAVETHNERLALIEERLTALERPRA